MAPSSRSPGFSPHCIRSVCWAAATTVRPTSAPATQQPTGGVRPAGTDEQGFLNSDARCDPGHPAAAMGSTTQTELVLCQTGPDAFYYRGVRLSDGALTGAIEVVDIRMVEARQHQVFATVA